MERRMSEQLSVEVIYALPEKQVLIPLRMPEGSTVRDAVAASGLDLEYHEVDFSALKVGVWAKLVKPDTPLRDRDRVEIYRPLIADPKEVRKQRAAAGKVMKKGAAEAGEGEA